jgi:hypothetical protein
MKYIEDLRTKHDAHKKRFAFGVSAGVTAVIALFWVTSFSYFNNPNDNVRIARTSPQNSPLNVIRHNIAGAYESITGSKVEFVKEEEAAEGTAELEYVPTPMDNITQ